MRDAMKTGDKSCIEIQGLLFPHQPNPTTANRIWNISPQRGFADITLNQKIFEDLKPEEFSGAEELHLRGALGLIVHRISG